MRAQALSGYPSKSSQFANAAANFVYSTSAEAGRIGSSDCIHASQSEPVRDAGLPCDDDGRLWTARKGPEVNRGLDLGHPCQHTSAPNILVGQGGGGDEPRAAAPAGAPGAPPVGTCPVGPQSKSVQPGGGVGGGVMAGGVGGGQVNRPVLSAVQPCALAGDAANSASPTRRR
jgi:hypothetical protein